MGPSIQQTLNACLSIQQMLSAWSLNIWMSEHRQEDSSREGLDWYGLSLHRQDSSMQYQVLAGEGLLRTLHYPQC